MYQVRSYVLENAVKGSMTEVTSKEVTMIKNIWIIIFIGSKREIRHERGGQRVSGALNFGLPRTGVESA